eukprot:8015362-Pyramimonas_sp.AAC.1
MPQGITQQLLESRRRTPATERGPVGSITHRPTIPALHPVFGSPPEMPGLLLAASPLGGESGPLPTHFVFKEG